MLEPHIETLDAIDSKDNNGATWVHYKLRRMDIPKNLKPYKEEILTDLEEALLVYKGGGVHSNIKNFSMKFET